jgi:predicted acylesterase/phospholipase RssA
MTYKNCHLTRTLSAVALLSLAGCALHGRHHAVPLALQVKATVVGFPDEVRYFPRDPGDIKLMETEFVNSWEREAAVRRADGQSGPLPPAAYLAVSGGGDNGAYGAGFLNGWTKSGTRPVFKVVTGVSTGALIAPFAFLGKDYDNALKLFYTSISQKDILSKRFITSAVLSDAMADTTPLWKLLEKYVTQDVLDAIGREYEKGRLLLIGTANLDARRPVVWNVGKLAASHRPGALGLVHKILRASAAIPGAFPPVMISVEANGQRFDEMHVDGSTATQAFVYWAGVKMSQLAAEHGAERQRKVYVIRNARLDPEWAEVDRRTLPIIFGSIDMLLQYAGLGDLYRIYAITQRDGTDFNLAYIPSTFKTSHKKDFDTSYMRSLYDVGYAQAAAGYRWTKQPPMLVGEDEVREKTR